METVKKLSELNGTIRRTLRDHEDEEFPVKICLSQGMEYPQFKITIEKEETEYFTDNTGQRWKKVK